LNTKTKTFVLFSFLVSSAFAQFTVNYEAFDWKFFQTKHYDVYFYDNDEILPRTVGEYAETAHEKLVRDLRIEPEHRIPIFIYRSHNDFQQTNVIDSYLPEGAGGVTEIFKNRVCFPFTGSYTELNHVTHHELLHAFLNDYFNDRWRALDHNSPIAISGYRRDLPLWAEEGLAEILSTNWSIKADLVVRDLTLAGYFPSIEHLSQVFPYQYGQSVWRFVIMNHGRESVSQIIQRTKVTHNFFESLLEVTGYEKMEDLEYAWRRSLKKEYWNDVSWHDDVNEFAERILAQDEIGEGRYNIAPAISPDGEKVAWITNRSGRFNVELFTIDGEYLKTLVKGERYSKFEELKILDAKLTWSPDGRKIAFAAKAGASDAIYIVDVDTKDVQKLFFGSLKEYYAPDWSYDGNKLAFVGNDGHQTDLYVYYFDVDELVRMTNDIYGDFDPDWSYNDRCIAFASERDTLTRGTDIFMLDTYYHDVTQLIRSDWNKRYPIWTDTSKFMFVSDYHGIPNLHMMDIGIYFTTSITNVATGIGRFSVADDMVVFQGYHYARWDIYKTDKLFNLDIYPLVYPTVHWAVRDDLFWEHPINDEEVKDADIEVLAEHVTEMINHSTEAEVVDAVYEEKAPEKEYSEATQAYKLKFTLDGIAAQSTYDYYFGYQGFLYVTGSDMVGNHKFAFSTNNMVNFMRIGDYSGSLSYEYRKYRWNVGGNVYHIANVIGNSAFFDRYRNYGLSAYATYPLSKFSLFGANLDLRTTKLERYAPETFGYEGPRSQGYTKFAEYKLNVLMPGLVYFFSNARANMWGPNDGTIALSELLGSPKFSNSGIGFLTGKFDVKQYFKFATDYTFAVRFQGGGSFGKNSQMFFLGGIDNYVFSWGETTDGDNDALPYRPGYPYDAAPDNVLERMYFGDALMPMRGHRFGERGGSAAGVANIELRFPLIKYAVLGFPLPMQIGYINGHLFTDIGFAVDDMREFSDIDYLRDKYNDDDIQSPWLASVGFGIKMPFMGMPFRIDVAWDLHKPYKSASSIYTSKPQYYISLGFDW